MKIRKIIAPICVAILLITGCSEGDIDNATNAISDVAKDITDHVSNYTDKDDEHVLAVKNGYPESYPDITYGNAFDEFFSSPTWKYFKADSGEDVVEFTGHCTYRDENVKARLQFILDMEEGSFSNGALSFNDVPQAQLITNILLNKVFTSYEEAHGIQSDDGTEEDEEEFDW